MNLFQKVEGTILFLIILLLISLSSLYSYLFFHTLAELYSIIISATIFIIVFNLKDKIEQGYLSVIGISYLFIAIIDLIHTLAYKGMNIFSGFDANLPTQLWIFARYLESFTFLLASLFINKIVNIYFSIIIYTIISIIGLISIFIFKNFPTCYIEGEGLTSFKIYSEYVICILLLYSLWILRKNKDAFPKTTFFYLQLAIITTILSEFSFTKYISVYGVFNFSGHILKIVSFFFIYKGVVKTALIDPFELLWVKLKESEKNLKEAYIKLDTYIELLNLVFVVIDKNQNIIKINQKGAEKLDYTKEELIGKNWFDVMIPPQERENIKTVFENVISGKIELVGYFENKILRKDGTKRIFSWHNTFLKDINGNIYATVSIGEDITDKKIYDENREKLIEELQKALENIKTLKGLLPICAWCKNIRTDEGYWLSVENYIKKYTNAEFSHSICPQCYEKLNNELKVK